MQIRHTLALGVIGCVAAHAGAQSFNVEFGTAGTAPDDLSRLFVRLNGSLSRNAFGATGFADLAEDRVDLNIRAEIVATA